MRVLLGISVIFGQFVSLFPCRVTTAPIGLSSLIKYVEHIYTWKLESPYGVYENRRWAENIPVYCRGFNVIVPVR